MAHVRTSEMSMAIVHRSAIGIPVVASRTAFTKNARTRLTTKTSA